MGLSFRNRIGLAAGFDKNARWLNELGHVGFGFIEVGTMTPRPQTGNARPRIFRLVEHNALINRMGFPNDGVEVISERIDKTSFKGVVGANIGVNATTPVEELEKDFLGCFDRAQRSADYVVINISSPNTPALREMYDQDRLRSLFALLQEARQRQKLQGGRACPILLKMGPDLTDCELVQMAELALELRVDGIVATNSTLGRNEVVNHPLAKQAGGLSGAPLAPLARRAVSRLRSHLGDEMLIIGVGGVMSVDDYMLLRDAGADLVQIYSGFVYRGPGLIRCIAEAGT